jgi:hypothetical protein
VAVPAALATPLLQLSVASACWGVSLPVHEKPMEPAAQPATVESAPHVVVVPEANCTQQKSVAPPLGLATPSLQIRAVLVWSGVSVPVQEKPLAPPVHPATVLSALQLLVGAVPVAQQNSVAVPVCVPVLQLSDGSPCWGMSLPVHEKPIEPAAQPMTLESAAHVEFVPAANDTQQKSVSPPLATPSLQNRDELV